MATSIGTEIAEFYYKVLLQYYENFKKRLPTETEKSSIKEAAQFGKIQNSEEDYVEIYSRIHGVSAEQARDEPSHLEKLKEFVAMNRPKRNLDDIAGQQLGYLSKGRLARIQGNRNPQYSYCTQEEMDKKQSKVPEKMDILKICYDVKDDDSDYTVKAFPNESDQQEVKANSTGMTVRTTAFSLTTVTCMIATSSTTTTTTVATSGPILSLNENVKAKGSIDSLLTCQDEDPNTSLSFGQLETKPKMITSKANVTNNQLNQHQHDQITPMYHDYNEAHKPFQNKIDFIEHRCKAQEKLIDESFLDITMILRSPKVEITASEYMGKLEKLEKACSDLCHDADFLRHTYGKQGNAVEEENYYRLGMFIRDAIKTTKRDVYQQIREMPDQLKQFSLQQGFDSSFSDFSERSKEFVVFSGSNEKVPENVRMQIPGQSQRPGHEPFVGHDVTNPNVAADNYCNTNTRQYVANPNVTTYNYVNENTNPFTSGDAMYMKSPKAASNVSFMPKMHALDDIDYYNHGTRVHGGGPAETTPNMYYDQKNQHNYYRGEPYKAPKEQESLAIAPQWKQTDSRRFTHAATNDDAGKMFEQFCEFLKFQNSRPTRPHVEQPSSSFSSIFTTSFSNS